jgi:hypothetical protein
LTQAFVVLRKKEMNRPHKQTEKCAMVVEVSLVNGVYDIVVKIASDALDSLKEP